MDWFLSWKDPWQTWNIKRCFWKDSNIIDMKIGQCHPNDQTTKPGAMSLSGRWLDPRNIVKHHALAKAFQGVGFTRTSPVASLCTKIQQGRDKWKIFVDAEEPNIQVRITPGSTSEFWFVAKMVVIPASLSGVSSFRLGVDQFQACVVDFSLCWCRMPAIDSNSSMSQPQQEMLRVSRLWRAFTYMA